MMESTQRSALARLLNGLKREQHDYRPSLEVFPALNIDKLAGEMALATSGADRGAREEPASDSIAFDDVENRIIERVEAGMSCTACAVISAIWRSNAMNFNVAISLSGPRAGHLEAI